jgi:hypothetical protein
MIDHSRNGNDSGVPRSVLSFRKSQMRAQHGVSGDGSQILDKANGGFKDTPFETSYSNPDMIQFESNNRLPGRRSFEKEVIGEEIQEIADENCEDRIESMS